MVGRIRQTPALITNQPLAEKNLRVFFYLTHVAILSLATV